MSQGSTELELQAQSAVTIAPRKFGTHPLLPTSWQFVWRRFPYLGLGANLPLIVASAVFSLNRAAINVDYLVFAACAPLFPQTFNLAVFGVLVALDWFMSLSGAYYLRVADALLGLRQLTHLSPEVWIPIALFLLVALALWLRLTGRYVSNGSAGPWRTNLIFSVLLVMVIPLQRVAHWEDSPLVQSSFLIAVESYHQFRPLTASDKDYWRVQSATHHLVSDLAAFPSKENIGIVVVESWGLFKNADSNTYLARSFHAPALTSRYTVISGSVPFHGSTVPAEMRELCGISAGFAAASGARSSMTGCLPWQLRRLGYQTVAMHGFTQDMFGRKNWYPAIGFEHTFFAENMPASEGFHRCGKQFPGICPPEILSLFRRELIQSGEQHRLVYWLTLGTHLHFDDTPQQHTSVSCPPPMTGQSWDVCGQTDDLEWLLSHLADIASDPNLPRTRFIIVGDHTPPFMMKYKRDLYVSERVPYLELLPK